MKSEETIALELKRIDNVEPMLDILRHYELDMYQYLADFVAALCNVSKDVMLGKSEKAHIAQPRWLFWYAYRYMTGETLEKVANMTVLCGGYKFTTNGIGQCVNKMSALISTEPLWQKRWNIIKRIIKLRDNDDEKKIDNTIVVSVPKHLRDKISITIKEK